MSGVCLSFPQFYETILTKPFYGVQKHWRRKQRITNLDYNIFMAMPLFFKRFSEKELRSLSITGQTTVSNYKLIYDNFNLSNFADKLNNLEPVIRLKQTVPGFINEQNYALKWWERERRIKSITTRRVQWGRLVSKDPQMRYFSEENYFRRNSLDDISNSLLHYVSRLFSSHRTCIRAHQINQRYWWRRKSNSRKKETPCFIAEFYAKFSNAVNSMGTHFRLVKPQITDSPVLRHKRTIMNELSGPNGRYTYDTHYHEFYNPINHLNEYIEESDVYAFHIYYEQFYKLFCQIMYEQSVTKTYNASEPMTLVSRYELLFYPSFSLKACAQAVLNHCTDHELCERSI